MMSIRTNFWMLFQAYAWQPMTHDSTTLSAWLYYLRIASATARPVAEATLSPTQQLICRSYLFDADRLTWVSEPLANVWRRYREGMVRAGSPTPNQQLRLLAKSPSTDMPRSRRPENRSFES